MPATPPRTCPVASDPRQHGLVRRRTQTVDDTAAPQPPVRRRQSGFRYFTVSD
jgi:hypothetical protein